MERQWQEMSDVNDYENGNEDYIPMKNVQPKKSKCVTTMTLIMDLLRTSILLILLIGIILGIYYIISSDVIITIKNQSINILEGGNKLITETIPNEISYYHNLTQAQNATISEIEDHMEQLIISINDISSKVDQLVSQTDFLTKLNTLVDNLANITGDTNIVQLQEDVNDIAKDLNKIVVVLPDH